jgi:hypothetical protein
VLLEFAYLDISIILNVNLFSAHPNVKIFITHGGLLSAQEAAYHGKTLIGVPIFGDQMLNMKRAQLGGYAVLLDFKNITKASVKAAIYEAIHNREYVVYLNKGKITFIITFKIESLRLRGKGHSNIVISRKLHWRRRFSGLNMCCVIREPSI